MPTRRAVLIGGALSGLAGPARATDGPPRLIDHMAAFWRAYDPVADSPIAVRADALAASYFAPNVALFREAGMGTPTAARIATWLTLIGSRMARVREMDRRIRARWPAAAARFAAALPDFDPVASPIHLMPSLLSFDGHLQPASGKLPLFIGVDGVAILHGADTDPAILFSHELFHCYQAQRGSRFLLSDAVPPLYRTVWVEGAATYASERLNPGAPLAAVLLSDTLAATPDEAVRRAARVLSTRLDSVDPADQAMFVDAGYRGAIPPRTGYLIGRLAAMEVGRRLSLRAIGGLEDRAVRHAVAATVSRLAVSSRRTALTHTRSTPPPTPSPRPAGRPS